MKILLGALAAGVVITTAVVFYQDKTRKRILEHMDGFFNPDDFK